MHRLDFEKIKDELQEDDSKVAVASLYVRDHFDMVYRQKLPGDCSKGDYWRSKDGYDIYKEIFPSLGFERFEICWGKNKKADA